MAGDAGYFGKIGGFFSKAAAPAASDADDMDSAAHNYRTLAESRDDFDLRRDLMSSQDFDLRVSVDDTLIDYRNSVVQSGGQSSLAKSVFKIIVLTYTHKRIELFMEPTSLVAEMKKMISLKEGFRIERQMLIFEGAQLDDAQSLVACGIGPNATVHLTLRLA